MRTRTHTRTHTHTHTHTQTSQGPTAHAREVLVSWKHRGPKQCQGGQTGPRLRGNGGRTATYRLPSIKAHPTHRLVHTHTHARTHTHTHTHTHACTRIHTRGQETCAGMDRSPDRSWDFARSVLDCCIIVRVCIFVGVGVGLSPGGWLVGWLVGWLSWLVGAPPPPSSAALSCRAGGGGGDALTRGAWGVLTNFLAAHGKFSII